MQLGSYGVNNLYKTGCIFLEKAPWYIFAIESAVEWLCDLVPEIPLPFVPMKDEDGHETTWHQYYGDTHQFIDTRVYMPVFQWAQSKKQTVVIDVPYEVLKEKFYATDKEFFDEEGNEEDLLLDD